MLHVDRSDAFSESGRSLATDPPRRTPGTSHAWRYVVTVTTATREQADQVMAERIGYDEDYGFAYSIDWSDTM